MNKQERVMIDRIERVWTRQEFVCDKFAIETALTKAATLLGKAVTGFKYELSSSSWSWSSSLSSWSSSSWSSSLSSWSSLSWSSSLSSWSSLLSLSSSWSSLSSWSSSSSSLSSSSSWSSSSSLDYWWGILVRNYYRKDLTKDQQKDIQRLTHTLEAMEAGAGWARYDNSTQIIHVLLRPIIHLNKDRHRHCENGKAVEWETGEGWYELNGVKVPEYVVMTPANELAVNKIFDEQNVEVRQELVKKIGIDRVLKDSNARCLDADETYELFLFDLSVTNGRFGLPRIDRKYLKMLNPSTFEYHIEGVDNRCKTINDALRFRNGDKKFGGTRTFADTNNAIEWQQQGDVLFFPKVENAVYKIRPSVIT